MVQLGFFQHILEKRYITKIYNAGSNLLLKTRERKPFGVKLGSNPGPLLAQTTVPSITLWLPSNIIDFFSSKPEQVAELWR